MQVHLNCRAPNVRAVYWRLNWRKCGPDGHRSLSLKKNLDDPAYPAAGVPCNKMIAALPLHLYFAAFGLIDNM